MVNVHTAAANTVRELRASVGLLRRPPGRRHEREASGGLADVGPLLHVLDAAGVHVNVAVAAADALGGPPRPAGLAELQALATGLPPEVDRTAYRIVQESTTNALRHADPQALELDLRRTPASLEIRIRNDGVATGAAPLGRRPRADRHAGAGGGPRRDTAHQEGQGGVPGHRDATVRGCVR